ncbi:putative lipid II flippase FtsW [Tessaracoccus caeni]|uniref:putative lipid II flippase FtsW n=1 Tax=Tessaracoccus caeni TaxID=3031239 RepID=UPI0023DA04FE|nr:putative lipid II flippase FtsW [Tessaracoccus caeni]MDF1487904.1 putative lipid II flippase FtsW [Tessaracoccus caeni]
MATEAPPRPKAGGQLRALLTAPLAPHYLIIASVGILVSIGSLMVLSASSVLALSKAENPYYYSLRQLLFLAIGLVGCVALARMKAVTIRGLGWIAWAVAVVLLMLVLTPMGHVWQGNRSGLNLGPVRIQPSELAKLALIVWGAAIFHRKRRVLHEPLQLIWPFLPLGGLIIALVLAGKDLGTGLIFVAIMFLMLWLVGTPIKLLALPTILGAAVVAVYVMGSENRMSRILIFLDPQSNTDLSSQPMSALYALASGGWWGMGLGASRQKWGGLKDVAHSDFIFAVIGEELGLFGVLLVLAMFGLLAYAGLEVAMQSDKMFNRVAAGGIVGWFLVQALINIAVVMHLLPVLGVTLPFVSYGGSSLLANLLGVGVLLSLARDTPAARRMLARRKGAKRPRMTSVMAASRGE